MSRSRVDRFLNGARLYQRQRDELLPQRSLLVRSKDGAFALSPEAYEYYEYVSDAERPFIDLHLYRQRKEDGRIVKKIEIVYLKFPDIPASRLPEPYTLLLFPLDIGQDVQPVPKRFSHILHEQLIHQLKTRRKFSRHNYRFTVLGDNTLVTYAHNVWNEYCLKEGNTTLNRVEFTIWLYRLTCIAADLIDYPFSAEERPGKRRKVIAEFLKDRWGTEYEMYEPNTWQVVLAPPRFDLRAATLARERDACKLFRILRADLPRRSPLEDFIWSIASSLYTRLCQDKLLKRCPHCSEYFPYDSRKRFCSDLGEGKRCARSFHNHANYMRRK